MKVVLVDDEIQALKTLKNYIAKYTSGVEIVGEAQNKQEAIALLNSIEFDLLILDINLSDGTGFDVLDSIKKKDFRLIFSTAYDEYAIKAFKYSALDYLLKPLDPDEFKLAIEKCKASSPLKLSEQIDLAKNTFTKQIDKIAIYSLDEVFFIAIKDIVRLESFKNYTQIFTNESKMFVASKTIKHYEDLLPADQFFRTHQCHIIALKAIEKFIKKDGGYVLLKNGKSIPVSRRKKELLLQQFLR